MFLHDQVVLEFTASTSEYIICKMQSPSELLDKLLADKQ